MMKMVKESISDFLRPKTKEEIKEAASIYVPLFKKGVSVYLLSPGKRKKLFEVITTDMWFLNIMSTDIEALATEILSVTWVTVQIMGKLDLWKLPVKQAQDAIMEELRNSNAQERDI